MASPQERSELPRGTETILLVEDDPAWRDLATNLLKRLGYNVLPAASGAEALELLGRTGQVPVDLLFTDLVMPGMNGEELAGRVRVLFPAMRILFTTAYSRDGLLRQGLSPEALGLLPKPYTPSALARKVREVLDA